MQLINLIMKIKANSELASATAVHAYLREKVGVAGCGGIRFGANWNGLYRVYGIRLVALWVADWVRLLAE